ncbi:hypothetical protein TUBRATIS_25950 [Tubulinosema ratisbonensis]|uniref:Uncharacterized protein n=1 Tax=Tubulinosema ratisbonensis TaxID=291195 RepID=A0A437AIK8_9MICR|nr:hypothetical protein TUBRATIS_25950 [Tubulinosema ratisbonensis]
MSDLSKKLQGLKFMQKAVKNKKNEDESITFSSVFCQKGFYSFEGPKKKKIN